MGHWRVQRKELLQVQIVTALALAATYFVFWPMLRPADPEGPLALLATGNAPGILAILLVMAVLAALTSAVTVHSRPVGSVVAALLGTGGLCMHSPSLHALLWSQEGQFGGMFIGFILELIALSVGVVVVCLVVGLVRQGIAGINPHWVWRDPLRRDDSSSNAPARKQGESSARGGNLISALLERVGPRGGQCYGKKRSALDEIKALAGCVVLAAVLSVVLYMTLVQSRARGQVLFALLASFTVAVLVAHQASPTSSAGPLLAMPIVLGVVIYLLGMFASAGPAAPNAWLRVPEYAHALPLDWITAGVGGAGLGFWISSRIHELRHMEKREQEQAG